MKWITASGTNVPRVAFILAFLTIICGPITGPQAIFHALALRGVYSDRCHGHAIYSNITNATTMSNPSYPCHNQEKAIEWGAELCLSICNLLCFAMGAVMDIVGAQRMAIGGMVIWIIAKGCAGIAPASGVVWTMCESIAAVMSLGAYTGVCLVHMKKACPNPRSYAFWCFVCSAVWDIAVFVNIPLAELYKWSEIPLGAAYAIYGVGAGTLFLFGLLFGFSDNGKAQDGEPDETTGILNAAEKENDGVQVNDADEKAASICEQMSRSFEASKAVLLSPMIWAVTFHSAVIVTLGYFLITMAGSFGRFLGASNDEAHRVQWITTLMMSGLGLANFVPGKMLEWWGIRRGLCICLGLEAFWLVAIVVLLLIRDTLNMGVNLIYAIYTLMFIWRVWGFGLCTPLLTWRFYEHRDAIGFAYGIVFTISGAVSMGAGNGSAHFVAQDSSRFVPVVVGMAVAGIVAEVLMLLAVAKTTSADPLEDANHPPIDQVSNTSFGKPH